jgi:NAD(P)H-hydrate epimerase
MKVVTAEAMQQLDRRAIEEFGVPGLELMERAGEGCAAAIVARFAASPEKRAVIVAGKGNNGGDGYVIARHLRGAGWEVTTLVLARPEEISGDAAVNLDRLSGLGVIFCPEPGHLRGHLPELTAATVVVDALFGTGLKSELRGVHREAAELINDAGRPVVAVDIPSGIDATSGRVLGAAVRADLTVTFAVAKLGHVLYPGAEFCGELRVIDIGIPAEASTAAPGYEFLDRASVGPLLRRRARCAHKGSYGHVLVVAGSTGKSGAAAMAANSAVRAGAGLVTLAVPESIHAILEVKTTEAMTIPLPDAGNGILAEAAITAITTAGSGKDVLALGPGIGWHPPTVRLVRELLTSCGLPLVLDADALNAVSADTAILRRKRSQTVILTPHPGEMARLTASTTSAVEADRITAARNLATDFGVFVILKGARTVIAAPDGSVAINGSGNPGMATGGMGDVLTGILAALLAQGYPPFTACLLGVFIHGHAADLLAAEKGEIGITAVDVQERLPYAFRDLME